MPVMSIVDRKNRARKTICQGGGAVIDHPVAHHNLSRMRNKSTPTSEFRQRLRGIAPILFYAATQDLPVEQIRISTPVAMTKAPFLVNKPPILASVLRAGNGLLDGMLELLPETPVAHLGLYRDPETFEAKAYYFNAPDDLSERLVLVLDPMLATAGTAIAAINTLKEKGVKKIRFVCLLTAPEGVEKLSVAHPDVPIFVLAIDDCLDHHAYIVPGLGDAGDRLYGTE